ncbi:MAG: BRO family protein [archaeon]
MSDALVVFQGNKIRRIWFNDEWWFSVVDIVGTLIQTDRARKYWSDLKKKLSEEGFQLSEKIGQLKLVSSDGKSYRTDCVNTKNAFRIIRSIPAKTIFLKLRQSGLARKNHLVNVHSSPRALKMVLGGQGLL